MKGATKPKIHVVIKDVAKVTDHNGRKYKYILVTNQGNNLILLFFFLIIIFFH